MLLKAQLCISMLERMPAIPEFKNEKLLLKEDVTDCGI